jgi:hypothetical protein
MGSFKICTLQVTLAEILRTMRWARRVVRKLDKNKKVHRFLVGKHGHFLTSRRLLAYKIMIPSREVMQPLSINLRD